jgi:glycosyltransferase involved in cell wall biosynthesis
VELGHDVLNISPVLGGEADRAQALRDVGVENWVARRPPSPLREVAAAVAGDPAVLAAAVRMPIRALEMRVFWTRLRALAERAGREWRPDVVVVGHDMAAGWAWGPLEALPAVLTLHNLTWHWYLSRAAQARGVRAFARRREAARYRRYVVRRLPRFGAAIAVSTLEEAELRALDLTRVEVIPTGVDTREIVPAPEQEGPPRLVFTGTLGYAPNHEGIRWFCERAWPEVRRRVPEARLDIVGKDPPPAVRALERLDGVTVVGPVPLMAPYFARAHVVVVPILTGAGIRVKIVEAMASGRAVVSTSLGWEGLPDVEPGRHLLAADDPADFAAAAARLLQDGALRQTLAAEARALAEREYDWRGLGDRQEAVIRAVAAKAPPPRR